MSRQYGYSQDFSEQGKNDVDYESIKANADAEKKRRLKAELVESHQKQIREKQEKLQKERDLDAQYSRTTAEDSSFANQDRQREQFFNRLKTSNVQSVQQPRQNNQRQQQTDIFNQDLVQRQEKQVSNDFDQDKLDKKRREREIFEENLRVAALKKN